MTTAVGVGCSAESVAALKWTGTYAPALGATPRASIAWRHPAAVGPAQAGMGPQGISDEVRQNMAGALAQTVTAADPGVDVDQVVGHGHPARVLLEASKEADLLVLGSRGHWSFTGMMAGSVSIHCVTHPHCPVLVARGDE